MSDRFIPRLGYQRIWLWRGWFVRYTYVPAEYRLTEYMPAGQHFNRSPLVLLHGFGASLGHWRHNLQNLSHDRSVYALDLLGFGASQKASAPYNPVFWSDLVYEFWQTFIGQPTILVGNSLGSVVAMTVAARYPEAVQALVMLNLPDASVLGSGSPPRMTSGFIQNVVKWYQHLLQPIGKLIQTVFTSPLIINPLLLLVRSPRILYPALSNAYVDQTAVDEELKQMIQAGAYDRHAAQALRFMTRGMGNVPNDYKAKSVLPGLQLPMLLVWGKGDRLVPPKLGPLCARLNSKIKFVELEGGGHCLQDECPHVINRLILEWIGEFDIAKSTDTF